MQNLCGQETSAVFTRRL